MEVTRVHDWNMSWIEPELDPNWDELTQLQWKAAVVELSFPVSVKVLMANSWVGGVKQQDAYQVLVGSSSIVLHGMQAVWMYLLGVETAAGLCWCVSHDSTTAE